MAYTPAPTMPAAAVIGSSGQSRISVWMLFAKFPSAASPEEKMRRFVDYARKNETPSDMVSEPDPQFVVPAEFDTWDLDRRQAHIEMMLNEIVTPYHGTNLRTLRSQTLEQYLN